MEKNLGAMHNETKRCSALPQSQQPSYLGSNTVVEADRVQYLAVYPLQNS